jgi:sugar phosphate isomerase/epimerase
MNLSRRNLLKLGCGAAAALVAGRAPGNVAAASAEVKKKIPIGLQLYSVRHQCQQDLPAVLKAVAEMGYEGVEFAGYYGRSAPEMRKLLDDHGLKCCGTHIGLNALTGDALKGTIEYNQTLGNPYLIVAGMDRGYTESLEAVKAVAEVYDGIAQRLEPLKMQTGYHAHGFDFRRIDGETTWDLLFENTRSDVIMQLDIGNCLGGGGDPYATLRRFPGRSVTVHLKEHGGPPEAVVGEGDVDWKQVLEICQTTGGTQWYIVEHERGAGDPLDNVRRCLENVRGMMG